MAKSAKHCTDFCIAKFGAAVPQSPESQQKVFNILAALGLGSAMLSRRFTLTLPTRAAFGEPAVATWQVPAFRQLPSNQHGRRTMSPREVPVQASFLACGLAERNTESQSTVIRELYRYGYSDASSVICRFNCVILIPSRNVCPRRNSYICVYIFSSSSSQVMCSPAQIRFYRSQRLWSPWYVISQPPMAE